MPLSSPLPPPLSPPLAGPSAAGGAALLAAAPRAEAGAGRDSLWREALHASKALIALSAFVLTALWGGIAYQIHRESNEALHNAEIDLTNLTRAFAEHSAKTIEGADQAIRFVRNESLARGKDLDLAGYLKDGAIIDSAYHLMSVIGPDGFVTHSSQPFQRVDLRDREHFRAHSLGAGDHLFVSKPVLGRVSGKWSIQLTRRIDGADGAFAGVVVLSLAPEYLTRFYGEVDLGAHGAITLVGYDGVVRARATRADSKSAQDLSGNPLFKEAMQRKNGTVRATSGIDKVDRLWAFRALDQYGLLVFTGMGVDDIMAAPIERRNNYLIGASVITVVVLLFVAGLLRRERTQLDLLHQLERSNEQANAANRMKTRLLASVSHELRTPLNGILGYAEMVRDTSSDADARECGDAIHRSAEHLHTLVNTILDLAKIESGRMVLAPSPVAAAEIARALVERHAPAAQARGLALVADTTGCGGVELVTDRLRLEQALGHLIDNAIKFTDGDTVRLVVRADRTDTDGATFEVADAGPGIAPAQLDALFTRFHTSEAEFVHAAQGPGLGLPLAKELLGLLGGTLAIRSTLGAGTTAVVRVPLVPLGTKEPR